MFSQHLTPAFTTSTFGIALTPHRLPTSRANARRARPIRVAPRRHGGVVVRSVASEPTATATAANNDSSAAAAAPPPVTASASSPSVTTTTPAATEVMTNLTDMPVPPGQSAFQTLADVQAVAELAAEYDVSDLRVVHEGVEVRISREGGRGFDADGNLAPLPSAAAAAVAPGGAATTFVPMAPGVEFATAASGEEDDDDAAAEDDEQEDDDEYGDDQDEDTDPDDAGADAAAAAADPDAVLDSDFVVTSNRVGFFLSGARNKPPLVTVGDRVAFNQPVCIIEQLGQQYVYLSEAAGTVVKVFIEDGEAVEFGSDIMVIRPD